MAETNYSSSVDAVITWVDGSDPVHAEKRAEALNKPDNADEKRLSTGHHKTRFLDNGELYYSIASLRKFAPWIRKIFIVTDNQVPDFLTPELQKRHNIHIIDHTTIFDSYEWALPTFNSLTIETAIWRIPGLSNQLIYLNDDFILTVPVKIDDFFQNGRIVLRGKWKKVIHYSPARIRLNNLLSRFLKRFFGITRSLNLLLQIRSARLAGFKKKYFYTPHVPHPIKTETVKNFYSNHQGLFEENIRYKFRNTDQHTLQYLANHLELQNGNAQIQPPDDALIINGETDFKFIIMSKIKKVERGDLKFLCVQGFEAIQPEAQEKLNRLLKSMFSSVL